MPIFEMSERTKKNLSACVGVPFERIVELSPEEEIHLAAQKHGGKIVFSKTRSRNRINGGNPLLAGKKIKTMQDVDKNISKVKLLRVIENIY